MTVLKHGPLPSTGALAIGSRSVEYVIQVITASTVEDPLDVLAFVTTTYGHFPGRRKTGTIFYCSSLTATQQADGKVWKVTATYATSSGSGTIGPTVTPLDEPWGISFSHTSKRQVLVHAYGKWKKLLYSDERTPTEEVPSPADIKKVAIVNSFGSVFDPAFEKEKRLLQISLTKNISLSAYNSKDPLLYDDSINVSDVVLVGRAVPKYSGLLAVDGRRATYLDGNGTPQHYMVMSYGVTVDPDLWATRLVDQGMKYKKYATDDDGVKDAELEATGTGRGSRSAKPIKLNGEGYSLDEANAATEGTGLACLLCFFTNAGKNWGPLDLPSSIPED